jgi:hypothetical protein
VNEWPFGSSPEDMEMRARLLIAFADGQEEAGFVVTARRMRVCARDVLDLLRQMPHAPEPQPTEEER